jgi:hypothetical protein
VWLRNDFLITRSIHLKGSYRMPFLNEIIFMWLFIVFLFSAQ